MVSGRGQFLTAQVEPGKANEPCRYAYIFPARIALSSEKTPPFQQAGFLATVKDLPLKTVEPYRYTLRRLRLGYLYHIEKVGRELKEVKFDDSGDTDKKPWFRIDTTIQELYIAFSEWKWDEAFQKKVAKAPADHMQKVTLKAGQPYVGSARQIGELVEEFRTEPGKLVSLRGFPDARKVCDSEAIYAEKETYAPKTSEDWRFLTRRWRDGGYEALTWTPLEKNAIPEVPCPTAQAENRVFLLAVHDSIGIAREFAALQGASVATLSSRNDWLAYQNTMAVYAKTLLKVQPSYAEHLQQHDQIVEEKYLGEWSPGSSTVQPPEEVQKKIRAPGPDEQRTFELRAEYNGVRSHFCRNWYGVIRKNRFPGAQKVKSVIYKHPLRNIGPREGHDYEWVTGKRELPPLPLPKYPNGVVIREKPIPRQDNGKPCWMEGYEEWAPAYWKLGALDAFLATAKEHSNILSREFKLLADARVAWLRAEASHGFVAAMRRGTNSSLAFLTEREKAFAESHTAFAIDEEGQRNAANLYLEGEGEASKLFWEVMAGEVEEKTFVNVDTTLAPLIQEFGFYLEYLPGMKSQQRHDAEAQQLRETKALQLHDAWDKRLYPKMQPDIVNFSQSDIMKIAVAAGLAAIDTTKQENDSASRAESNAGSDAAAAKKQENKNDPRAKRDAAQQNASPRPSISEVDEPPLAPRSAAAKPLEFYIRKEVLKAGIKEGRDVVIKTIKSRCLKFIRKNPAGVAPGKSMYIATRMFEYHMKYWSLFKAVEKAATDFSFVSAFKLVKALSSVFAVRNTRGHLAVIGQTRTLVRQPSKGLAVFLGKGVGKFFGLAAETADIVSLAQKDDYDAAYMTAGTVIVTVTLGFIGASAFVTVPVSILGAVIAGYWTNSVDEHWLTHSFWGTYYKGAYESSPYPLFSYKEFFEKLDKMKPAGSITEGKDEERAPKAPKTSVEDEARDPKAPKTGVDEHGVQQKQWISMMSAPTLTCTSFINYYPGDGKTLLHVKYTVRFFDYLQSSIVPWAALTNPYGKYEVLALSDKPTDLMPVPFRLFLETKKLSEGSKATPPKGLDAGGKSDLTDQIQTVSLEGVFSVSALLKRANANNILDGLEYTPSLILDMTFNYLPKLTVDKPKLTPEVWLEEFRCSEDETLEKEITAWKRYNELMQRIADE